MGILLCFRTELTKVSTFHIQDVRTDFVMKHFDERYGLALSVPSASFNYTINSPGTKNCFSSVEPYACFARSLELGPASKHKILSIDIIQEILCYLIGI